MTTDVTVLTPLQALARYQNELILTDYVGNDEHIVIRPVVIGTIFFKDGTKPHVRQAILECFDEFEAQFGKHLIGGMLGEGRYTKKTAKGIAAMRRSILETEVDVAVDIERSSVGDGKTAPEYSFAVLTDKVISKDVIDSLSGQLYPKGFDGGRLSALKFHLPYELFMDAEGILYY